jgi:metal-sulfur cluster biosynthetic enzyme
MVTVDDVLERLGKVMDPETGIDVVNMKLISELEVTEDGNVSVTFAPSSPFCPLGIQLAFAIKDAAKDVEGVAKVTVRVDNHLQADMINEMLEKA